MSYFERRNGHPLEVSVGMMSFGESPLIPIGLGEIHFLFAPIAPKHLSKYLPTRICLSFLKAVTASVLFILSFLMLKKVLMLILGAQMLFVE